jgi:hypothetical protein
MVARAHAVHDYSFAGSPVRPRRQVWLQDEEPVVLPRGRSESRAGAALIISAILASVLVAGATYAVYRTAPPELAETPSTPFVKAWEPDAVLTQASTLNVLLGPAMAAQSVEGAPLSEPAPASEGTGQSREVIIDDSAPGLQQALPQPAPEPSPLVPDPSTLVPDPSTLAPEPPSSTPTAPYPNPTITPPEMVAPPEAPPVDLGAENPY